MNEVESRILIFYFNGRYGLCRTCIKTKDIHIFII